MGGTKPWAEVTVGNKNHTSAAVVIIGAGISGMCTAIDLIKRNKCHNFIILEKSGGVGGTWRDNKYPGCCCDVWSMLYSYSFEQNPDWTREYPGQEEILEYLVKTASKYNLHRYIRFNTAVESAEWDESSNKWKTKVKVSGEKDAEFNSDYTITSDFLVSAVGQLNSPKYPDVDGLDSFKGKIMHTARWDWTYDLEGKRIAIIGNGATAAQVVPEVAKVAKQLAIFQRTPNWVVPRMDKPVSGMRRTLYRILPPLQWRVRADQMDFRESTYQWIADSTSVESKAVRDLCAQMMRDALPGQEELWRTLTPTYNPGCKRILISDDYYPSLALPNVTLETRSIDHITDDGIVIKEKSGETKDLDFDLIVLATGFRTLQFMHPISITGTGGRSLSDVWSAGARAYNGVCVPSLPNFAMLYGPNTNLGHNSIILMIEAQSRYISGLVSAVLDARMRDGEHGTNVEDEKRHDGMLAARGLALVPKPAAVDAYNEKLQKTLADSAFADPACNSWYKDPNSGLITNNWSGTVVEYQENLSRIDWDDFEGGEVVKSFRKEKAAHLGRVVEETQVSDRLIVGMGVAALVLGGVWRYQKALSGLLRA